MSSSTTSPSTTTSSVPTTAETRATTTTDASSKGSGETSDTKIGTDSSGGSSSSDTKDSSGPGDAVGSDHAPRFGLSLNLRFEGGTPRGLTHPRVYIAQVAIKNKPADPSAAAQGPEFAVQRVAYDYPLFAKDTRKRPKVILPTPNTQDIDSTLQRSGLYMIALYNDADQDKRWTVKDGFFGASPSLFFYQPATAQESERWMRWDDFEAYAQVMKTPVNTLIKSRARVGIQEQESSTLSIQGFASLRQGRFGGQKSPAKLSHDTSFLTAMTRKELQDLPASFIEGPRPVDLDLRSPDANNPTKWSLNASSLNTIDASRKARFVQEGIPLEVPPGLALREFVALPLVGYARPVGSALPKEGQFLTADSRPTYSVCRMLGPAYAALLWVNPAQAPVDSDNESAATPTPWITRPIGALYAASLGLGPGWGIGLTTLPYAAPTRLLSTQSDETLYINNTCAKASFPKDPAPSL